MLGGVALIVLGLVWLVGGLQAGYFYPYSIVVIIAGVGGCVKSLF